MMPWAERRVYDAMGRAKRLLFQGSSLDAHALRNGRRQLYGRCPRAFSLSLEARSRRELPEALAFYSLTRLLSGAAGSAWRCDGMGWWECARVAMWRIR